ncbi:hypothetical protein RHSIM_Rhsim09G0022200 [Rhododendron simsii]|uniref:Aminotransferase-like plant mobile domain-containing protein n=1 Tax=Rhododendron simsii TaxID=118357 RepID=A0A834GHL8_RHOSS|nr:hypothetical protein RHSIM_Rhsim09G0022200 [Rhododendron simsii]
MMSSDNNGDGDKDEGDEIRDRDHSVLDYCFSDLPKLKITTATKMKKKAIKSKTKTILVSIIVSVIYQIKGGDVYNEFSALKEDFDVFEANVLNKYCPVNNNGDGDEEDGDEIKNKYHSILDHCFSDLPNQRQSIGRNQRRIASSTIRACKDKSSKGQSRCMDEKFMKSGSRIEHEAFLSLWLSKFLFPSAAGHDTVGNKVLHIAIHRAQGLDLGEIPGVGTESKSPGIWVSELVGLDCVEEYFPHSVARQFGMDQDIPRKVVLSQGKS